jgi:phospholipid/cholesterol/gamma-HCH transport system substrate-binding protein
MNTRYLTLAIFVTVTMSSLVGLAWMLDALPKGGKTYFVRLDDAGGLVEGNSVRIAGVQVGKIVRLDVEGNQARVEMRIDGKHKILEGTCASDQIKGMLGEKFLQLRQPKEGPELRPNSEITCVDPSVDMGAALNSLSTVIEGEEPIYPIALRLMKRLDAVTAVLETETEAGKPGESGEAAKPAGEGTMRGDLRTISRESAQLLKTANEMLAENREDVRAIVKGTRALIENPKIGRMIDKGESMLSAADRALPGLLSGAKRIVDDTEAMVGKLDKKLDAIDDGKIRGALTNLEAASGDLKKIAHDFRDMAPKFGPLLDDMKTLVHRATWITPQVIKKMLMIDGMRVRIGVQPGLRKQLEAEAEAAEK